MALFAYPKSWEKRVEEAYTKKQAVEILQAMHEGKPPHIIAILMGEMKMTPKREAVLEDFKAENM